MMAMVREAVASSAEEQVFRALIRRHEGAIARLCRHYESTSDGRLDLQQEILVAVWRAQGAFRNECSERTWVYRIAHNVAASYVARSMRSRAQAGMKSLTDAEVDEPDQNGARPDTTVEQRDALNRLRTRIRALDLVGQQIILLALEGCSTAEIAEVTGLSSTNVTTRLSRIRTALMQSEEQGNR